MSVVGLDLGGTKLSGAVFASDGKILFKEISPLEKREGKEVGALLTNLLSRLMNRSDEIKDPVESIGLCVPGISYKSSGKVWAPNIPGWDDYQLLDEIKRSLPRNIPVEIDSDRACYILGEKWLGAARGLKDAIFLAVGTGIGAGIMIDEKVLRGSQDIAGAIGWLALNRPYREEYKSCGDFEYNASGEGLVKVTGDYLDDSSYKGILRNKNKKEITAKDVFEAYAKKDEIAVKVIDNAIKYWGMTAANLVSLFNPEKIIFGGGVFGPALQFLDNIYEEALKWAQPISIKQVQLSGSELGGDAGLIGAGYLALKAVHLAKK
jgi:glucokinase